LSSTSKCTNLKICDFQQRQSRYVCTWIATKLTRFLVSYLFVIYLTTLVVPQTTHSHATGLLVNMDWKSRRIGWGLIWCVVSSFVWMDRGKAWKNAVRLRGWLARMLNAPHYKALQIFRLR
jgi:hypothetical protein